MSEKGAVTNAVEVAEIISRTEIYTLSPACDALSGLTDLVYGIIISIRKGNQTLTCPYW